MKGFLKKRFLGIPIGIIAAVLVGTVAVLAATWIYSNKVTVHVAERPAPPVYELTLAAPGHVFANEVMTFTGSLTADGAPVEGAHVYVYDWTSGSEGAGITDGLTIADGTFSCAYTPTAIGTYDFKAAYQAP